MVLRLVDEIRKSLDNDIYLSALMTALTLPDICGKAEFPNDKPAIRYKKWYDEHIGKYEQDERTKEKDIPYESGEVIYNLRNSLIHSGNPDINETTCNIQEFELLIEDKRRTSICTSAAGIIHDYDGDEVVKTTRSLCINVRQLCFKLCACAEYYYKNNKDKFGFINSKITNWNPMAREIFLLKTKGINS